MEHEVKIGGVLTQYRHVVLVGGLDIGAVLETTITRDNSRMERTYSAHVHWSDHRMLSTVISATFAECVALVVAEYAAHINAPIVDAAAESVKS